MDDVINFIEEVIENKRIWRAQINASGGTAVREKRMKLMARDLITRLSDEKLISSEPRPKGKQW